MSLTAETSNRNQTALVWFRGDVTEAISFPELMRVQPGHDIVLYLADVRRLNSFGVREWIRGMHAAQSAAPTVIWVECSYNVVQQLNMIQGFAGGARICSVRAPFSCEKCGAQEEHPLTLVDWNGSLPNIPCPKCGAPMELDEEPDSYFAFRQNEGPFTQAHRDLYNLYLNWNNPDAVKSGPRAAPPVQVEAPTQISGKTSAPAPARERDSDSDSESMSARRGDESDSHFDVKMRYFLYGVAVGAIATALTMGLWMAATA